MLIPHQPIHPTQKHLHKMDCNTKVQFRVDATFLFANSNETGNADADDNPLLILAFFHTLIQIIHKVSPAVIFSTYRVRRSEVGPGTTVLVATQSIYCLSPPTIGTAITSGRSYGCALSTNDERRGTSSFCVFAICKMKIYTHSY